MRSGALARRQLIRNPIRLTVALLGVAFAVLLMLMQLGFRGALFASSVRFHNQLAGEVFLISPQSMYLAAMRSFSWRRLYQALSHPEVASASGVRVAMTFWKNPQDGKSHRIFVAGIDPRRPVFSNPDVEAAGSQLNEPDVLLFDRASRPAFGPVVDWFTQGRAVRAEVNGREMSVVGLFSLGTSFGIDGNLVTSDQNFLRLFPGRKEGLLEIGVLHLRPGADAAQVQQELARRLPADVEVLTKEQWVEREQRYWASATPIGFVFTFGTIMGFVVGMVIVYQILFSDVSDHLAEYATLKAIGYTDSYLYRVVLSQALWLSFLGFLPGALISNYLYGLTTRATKLPMYLGWELAGGVLLLTMLMCMASGLAAVRKVRSADPADIF